MIRDAFPRVIRTLKLLRFPDLKKVVVRSFQHFSAREDIALLALAP